MTDEKTTNNTGTDNAGRPRQAAILVIGDEILSGRTQDTNIAYIARGLTAQGIDLTEVGIIPDDEVVIARAINRLRQSVDYLFTTGGIGPTHDDITAKAVGRALGLAVKRNPKAVARLRAHYGDTALNAARLSMADMPEGATLIDNPVSQAPGFCISNVYALAGVPRIMQAMFDGLLPQLAGGPPMASHTLNCLLTEGDIAADLARVQVRYPGVSIGSYPYFRQNRFGVSVVLRSRNTALLDKAVDDIQNTMHRLDPAIVLDETRLGGDKKTRA